MRPRHSVNQGFTLIEVMVAMTVFVLIAAVTLRGMAISMDSFERIRYKTFAAMIAQNALAEIRIKDGIPAVSESKTDVEFANTKWKLVTNVSATEDVDLVRVDFQVFRKQENGEDFKEVDYLGFVGKH